MEARHDASGKINPCLQACARASDPRPCWHPGASWPSRVANVNNSLVSPSHVDTGNQGISAISYGDPGIVCVSPFNHTTAAVHPSWYIDAMPCRIVHLEQIWVRPIKKSNSLSLVGTAFEHGQREHPSTGRMELRTWTGARKHQVSKTESRDLCKFRYSIAYSVLHLPSSMEFVPFNEKQRIKLDVNDKTE